MKTEAVTILHAKNFRCGVSATKFNMLLVLLIAIILTTGTSVGLNLGGLIGVCTLFILDLNKCVKAFQNCFHKLKT
jgi:hypothetical protein